MFAVVILLFFSLFSFSYSAQAQTDATWYFAQRGAELVAFTPDGEENVFDAPFEEVQAAWRWDAETVVMIVEDEDDATHFYRVTPQEAVEIPLTLPDGMDSDNLNVMLIAYAGDYLLFRETTPTQIPSLGILVHVAEASAEMLTGVITREARFADEATLRYISVSEDEAADTETWSLLERSLLSGDESAIYSLTAEENTSPFFTVNSTGDSWVSVTRNADRQLVSTLVHADGSTEPLERGTTDDPMYWRFVGDTLFNTQPRCETDCPITVRDGDEELKFTLPNSDAGFNVMARPTRTTLLVSTAENGIMLLSQDEAPQVLGEFDPRVLLSNRLLSLDKRYVYTASVDDGSGDTRQLLITDLQTGEQVFAANIPNVAGILWLRDGFIATGYGEDSETRAYFYDDAASVQLAYGNAGTYFEILPDKSLLYMLGWQDTEIGQRGIYRYDPASDTYTLLVEGARILYAQPLEFAS